MASTVLARYFCEKNAFNPSNKSNPRSEVNHLDYGMFTVFSKLPTELRLKVWEFAVIPRIVEVVVPVRQTNPIHYHFRNSICLPKPEPVGMLRACRESRAIAQKWYTFQIGIHHQYLMPLNLEQDIVLIPDLRTFNDYLNLAFWKRPPRANAPISNISTVAIDLKFQATAISGNGQNIFFETGTASAELTRLVEHATTLLQGLQTVFICAGSHEGANITHMLRDHLRSKKEKEITRRQQAIRNGNPPPIQSEWTVPSLIFVKYESAPLFSRSMERASATKVSNLGVMLDRLRYSNNWVPISS
ncbi:hypothetical protein BGZ60DRAFT_528744 [Tricladium varicosporioides]|nr:hypothetical protein BGZ60DRAFT_528744 [Hymenoscyphus varicosporioides]